MLPIHAIRDAILASLRASNRLVLSAPTGSGKTTQVPRFLLDLLPPDRQVIILQPRRLAARLVAGRVAREMGTPLGELVGYQTRHDSRISGRTRLRFMTEGLFLRLLQASPTLDGVGAVVLDEFHERNLASDASLAMVKLLQERSRPDLLAVVMSATLDVSAVSAHLACPVLETHGRAFPVDVRYLDKRPVRKAIIGRIQRGPQEVPTWELAADALLDVLDAGEEGDVLVFMPGAYEIRRTIEQCQRIAGADVALFPLYSELPADQQDAALAPAPAGRRKVIVATNVAETSITIEGVRHVIDSGLARVARFDPRRGLNVLAVEPISQASAEQRAGRAGRTAPGTCTRLWLEREHRHRPAHHDPEVKRLDLAETVLQLVSFGVEDVRAFPWLDAPEPLALDRAIDELTWLGAIDDAGRLTDVGLAMARVPAHPRLARMLLEASRRGVPERAALWAALISERDILQRDASVKPLAEDLPDAFPRSDFLLLEAALRFAAAVHHDPARCAAKGINALACREVVKTQRLLLDAVHRSMFDVGRSPSAAGAELRTSNVEHRTSNAEEIGRLARCLLAAFPDHLALLKNPSNLACELTRNRRGLLDPQTLTRTPGLVLPIDLREIGSAKEVRTVLSLVTEVHPDWLIELEADRIRSETLTLFNPATMAAETVDRDTFDGLVIAEKTRHEPDRAAAASVLAARVLDGTLKLERWDDEVEQWVARVRCLAGWFPERKLITYDDDERRLVIEELCAGATRYKEVRDKPVLPHVRDALSYDDQRFVEQMAPERIALPRGFRMRVQYAPGSPPRGRAKIQDLYDLQQSPTVAAGRVRVLLEILGPNFRPLQVTDDLANFWKTLYPEIRPALARRYPRHEWR